MIIVGYSSVCESLDGFSILNEGTEVNGEKLMTEEGQDVISVKIGGKEYRYIAKPDCGKSIKEIWKSFKGMMRYSKAGFRALAYLKKYTLCYYGCKFPEKGLEALKSNK